MADQILPVAILAGGLGTRLGELTKHTPKSMIEVAGEPFIRHQFRVLNKNGVKKIVICAGHLGEQIWNEIEEGEDNDTGGMSISFIQEYPDQPLGTAGALRNSIAHLGDAFFVLYGDSYLNCDMPRIQQAWKSSGKLALMTICDTPPGARSNVEYRFGELRAYDKQNPTPAMQHIDYGLGIITARALASNNHADLADVYRDLALHDQLEGFLWSKRYYSIGSPSGLEETRRLLSR